VKNIEMILRLTKIALLVAVAFYYTLVVFNNLTDYESNYQFVKHVLSMDTTFPGNHGMWRAIHEPLLQKVSYDIIIAWEGLAMVLTWIGAIQLMRHIRKPVVDFNTAKRLSVVALTIGLLLWFVAFLTVGGEWFLMWQSKLWNGQEEAFRMFAILGIIFVLLVLPDSEAQP
jgi:predicted small integral membrane protein